LVALTGKIFYGHCVKTANKSRSNRRARSYGVFDMSHRRFDILDIAQFL
jgi:hypothetical protein